MPWHYKTMKDATTCEKLWGAGSKQWTRDIRMGEPGTSNVVSSTSEYIASEKETQGTETSKYLEEKKENRFPK